MAIKILVDCIHNGGKITVSSKRKPDIPYSLAEELCGMLKSGGIEAVLTEDICVERFGTDSIRGRIRIAGERSADCYVCFHSNPSGRYRGCGVAAHVRHGDEAAVKIAESILGSVSENTNLNPIGIYHGKGLMLSDNLPHPVILELAFNPYSSGFTPYRQELLKLPGAVYSGLASVFVPENEPVSGNFQEYLDRNPGVGLIKVQVRAGRSSIPIPEARVVISKKLENERFVLADVTTDANGMTGNISLPAPPAYLSQSPGNADPYSFYDIEISHPDYKTVSDRDVPVFDGVLSIQNTAMSAKERNVNG